ncbi:hypothetical protein [Vibrio astriarenae]|uniref:hypothetical protein n=1 Tax=Vibrio astriarenae TaxID=1481923 RepID=UPI003734E146
MGISSPKQLAQFSSIVKEHCNAYLIQITDLEERIDKRSLVEAVIAQLIGFDKLNDCQHQLKKGFEIEFAELLACGTDTAICTILETPTFSEKVSDWLKIGEIAFVSKVLSKGLHQAVSCYQRPTTVTVSDAFTNQYPFVIGEASDYENDSKVAVYLSLIDHKLYPYVHTDFDAVQCIWLDIPNLSYVDTVIKKLNSEYGQKILTWLHEHMPTVSFSQEECDLDFAYHNGGFIFSDIDKYNDRLNAFVYHQMLLGCLLGSAQDRVTTVDPDDILTWQSAAYLVTNSISPLKKIKKDLPDGVVIACESDEELHSIVGRKLIMGLDSKMFRNRDVSLILPQHLYTYFEDYIREFGELNYRSVTRKGENHYIFQNYRNRVGVLFAKPEFRLWIHYNQQHSHKVDRLTDAVYKSRDVAMQAAVELLCQYEHLQPDWDSLTTSEFSIKVIDVTHYLNLEFYKFCEDIKKGKDTTDCEGWFARNNDAIVDCNCRSHKFDRMKSLLCKDNVALIAGSGLSTTRLRTPLLFAQQATTH